MKITEANKEQIACIKSYLQVMNEGNYKLLNEAILSTLERLEVQLLQLCVVGQSEEFYCNQNDGEYNNNPCSEQCRFCKEAKSLK